MDFVAEHNEGDHSFTVGLNKFADLTNTEFLERYTGFHTAAAGQTSEFIHDDENVGISGIQVDWRSKGAVTGVKDQGQCGSCWSFSTTGAVEGIWKLKNGTLTSLSEQNLMDCSRSYGNMGCNGGLMDSAFKYIINNQGIDTEKSYPYEMKTSYNCRYGQSGKVWGAVIHKYYDVRSGSESSLQTAVNGQPVSVAIDASNASFQLYKGGIYNEPKCSSSRLDHGVLAVGYGHDGSDYWIVKNSWGTGWGDAGYIYMSRNANNQCGIATQASYPYVSL